MDYKKDTYGKECLNLAAMSKSNMKFGAIVVRDAQIIGKGWNRLATKEDRGIIPHVDYCIHSEQAAILDAILRDEPLINAKVYVLGYGARNGILSTREGKYFTCKRCSKSLVKFDLPVMIPTPTGWVELSPEEATESAKYHKGYWQEHIKK